MVWGQPLVIGVDPGEQDIKVVVAQSRRGGPILEHALRLRLAPYELGERGERVEAALRPLFASARGPLRVAVAVPMAASTLKFLQVPNLPPADLRRVVELEAQTQLPLPAGEVELDFAPLGLQPDGSLRVLLAACRRDVVRATLEPLERLGVTVETVQITGVALYNALMAGAMREVTEPLLLLDVGARHTTLVIVDRGGELVLARSLALGAAQAIEGLAHDLDLTEDEATARWVNLGFRAEGEVEDTLARCPQLARWLEALAEEVLRSCQAFRVERGRTVTSIEAFGGVADAQGFRQALTLRTELPCALGRLWSGYRRSGTLEGPDHLFGVATGLVLDAESCRCPLNLMPRARLEASVRRRQSRWSAATLAASLALSALSYGWVYRGERELRRQLVELQQQEDQWRSVSANGPVATMRQGSDRMKQVYRAAQEGADWLPLLRQLSEQLPGELWLDQVSLHRGRQVILKGTALDHTALADALNVLRGLTSPPGSPAFTQIRPDYAHEARIGEERVVEFQITARLPGGEAT